MKDKYSFDSISIVGSGLEIIDSLQLSLGVNPPIDDRQTQQTEKECQMWNELVPRAWFGALTFSAPLLFSRIYFSDPIDSRFSKLWHNLWKERVYIRRLILCTDCHSFHTLSSRISDRIIDIKCEKGKDFLIAVSHYNCLLFYSIFRLLFI